MASLRNGKPYIWVTWLAKVLAGETRCEWSTWFRAHTDPGSWQRVPRNGDMTEWLHRHSELLHRARGRFHDGHTVTLEDHNYFVLRGRQATIAGKPDLVAIDGDRALVLDAKTGSPKRSHDEQVMLYMLALSAMPDYEGVTFDGAVYYEDFVAEIPAARLDDTFTAQVRAEVDRIAGAVPPARAPSYSECSFCEITSEDCPERVNSAPLQSSTSRF